MELIEERRRILLDSPHIETISTSAFKTDMIAPFKKLEARFDAEQNLHGASSPYLAGQGANQWDEVWEAGSLSASNGDNITDSSRIRSKNYISIIPGETYYVKTIATLGIRFYDTNKVFLGSDYNTTKANNTTLVAPEGAYFMRFTVASTTSYESGIAINYPSTVTTYAPYENICPIEGRTDMVVRHIGKNLFDKGNPLVKNKYVSVDGSIQVSSSYQYSDYYTIVQPNTNYIFSGKIVTGSTYNTISFYDNSKNFIGRHVPPRGGTGATFTTPVNCCYIRFNIGLDAELDTIQLEAGSEATEYESYTEPYYPLGKNLADPSSIIKGGYYSGSGAWSANTVSATTGLIRVKPNTTYVSSIFDNAGTRLNACVATLWNDATTCTGQITTQKFTTGSQTQYVRIRNFDAQGSYITNDDFKFQLEEGETPTDFEEYKGIGYIVNWGKNLFNQSLMKDQTAWNIIKIYAPVGTKLIMSTNQPPPAESGLLTYFMYSGGQQSSNENCYINHPVARTVPEIGYVQVAQRNRDNISSVEDWNYQIEIDSEASEYQPYVGEVYGGTIDLINGTLTVDRVKETFVFDNPTEDSTYNLESQRFTLAQRSTGASIATNKITNVCGNYAYAQASWQEGEPHFYIGTTACIIYLTKNAYRGGDIEVCYPLATPITYQLTPQQILTLKNNNTLMPEGTINEIKYWTHI